MSERVLFVDLENVQKVELARVPEDVRVIVFYGASQKKLPVELVEQAQPLGARLKWIKIAGQGPNALDFHIAYYLGCEVTARPHADCTMLSRDAGFDPLMRHLTGLGFSCRRVTDLTPAFPVVVAPVDKDDFPRLVALLTKDKARPSKRKGLDGKVKSWFPALTAEGRTALVQRLIDEKHLRESGKVLAYDL